MNKLGLGTAMSAATHQMSVWVAAGAAMGVGFGLLMNRAARTPNK